MRFPISEFVGVKNEPDNVIGFAAIFLINRTNLPSKKRTFFELKKLTYLLGCSEQQKLLFFLESRKNSVKE